MQKAFDIWRSSRSLWALLAGLQAVLSVWLVQATQHTPSLTLLCVVVWGGAVICLEDELEHLDVSPSRASVAAGVILLVYSTWRSGMILDKDTSVFILPMLQGIGLAMLTRPIHRLSSLWEPLFVLSLFPLQAILTRALPEYWMSVITGRISQLILLLLGENAEASGQVVAVGERAVFITGSCNSIDLIAQLTAIAIVFVLAFPISSQTLKGAYIALAPVVALIVNAVRIAILAAVHGSELANREQLFHFLHDEWGALVFAGLATMIMGQIYLSMIDRQLNRHHG